MISWVRFLSLFLCCLVVLGGCGKVVQDTVKVEEVKSTDFSYQVSGFSGAQVYTQVSAVDMAGKWVELSWGRAELKPVAAKAATKDVVAVSYRKDGVVLSGVSDTSWSKLLYDSKTKVWLGDSRKLRLGYAFYVVSVYSDASQYAFRVVDAASVSQNRQMALGSITPYDTFLASLFLTMSRGDVSVWETPRVFSQLSHLYSKSVFDALVYSRPKNKTEKFSPHVPVFEFSSEMEKTLLSIFQMAQTDVDEAVGYVERLRVTWLPKEAKKRLIASLKTFKK